MATKNQTQANRRNARRSTGPRTPEGKARSSTNGLKHGFYAKDAVIPGENEEDFHALYASFRETYNPADQVEEVLVRQMAAAEWRLQSVVRLESGTFRHLYQQELEHEERWNKSPSPDDPRDLDNCRMSKVFYQRSAGVDLFSRYARYENSLRRSFFKAMEHLERRRQQRCEQPPPEPNTKNEGPNPISPNSTVDQLDTAPSRGVRPRSPPAACGFPSSDSVDRPLMPSPSPINAAYVISATYWLAKHYKFAKSTPAFHNELCARDSE